MTRRLATWRLHWFFLGLAALRPRSGKTGPAKCSESTEHDFRHRRPRGQGRIRFRPLEYLRRGRPHRQRSVELRLHERRVVNPSLKTYEEGSIHATFNTPSFLGQRGATLTVMFDKPFYAQVQLHVKGLYPQRRGDRAGQRAVGRCRTRHRRRAQSEGGLCRWRRLADP